MKRKYWQEDGIAGYQEGEILIERNSGHASRAVADGRGIALERAPEHDEAAEGKKLKRWRVDAGNSTDGPCGFVVCDVMAATKEEALERAREIVPENRHCTSHDESGREAVVIVFFNAAALTLDNIEEDEDDDDEDDQ